MRKIILGLVFLLAAAPAWGQGNTTKIRSVGTLPATCSAGSSTTPQDIVAKDQLLYICQPSNVWKALIQDPGGNGIVVRTALGTSVNRSLAATTNETSVSNADGTAGNPTVALAATVDMSAKTATLPVKATTIAGAPGSCTANKELLIKTDATAGQQLFICNSGGNGWNLVGDGTSAGGGYTTIQEEASDLTQRAKVNFIGTEITCVDNAGATKTDCTVDISSNTRTLTNKTYDAEATGNVFSYSFKAAITAAGCNNATSALAVDTPTSSGATANCLGTAPNRFGVVEFADGSTSRYIVHATLPSDWTSTGGFDVKVFYTGSTSSSNNIRWQVSTACVADGEDLLAPSFNTASASNSAGPTTAGQRKSVSFTGVSVTNCAAGETMFLQFERIGADAGDTYTGIGQIVEYEITGRRAI